MKTLFSKILLAQLITVLVALLVVSLVTRLSLVQGFNHYLGQQEAAVLRTLTPALANLHQSRGGWEFLGENPRAWDRIWRQTQKPGPQGRPPRSGPGDPGGVRPLRPPDEHLMRWMRSLDRPMIRSRLFLLDENYRRIAGAEVEFPQDVSLQAVESNGEVVGWIGFAEMGQVLPPDAQRFMERQVRLSIIGFLVAIVLAVLLGYLLARQLSRPVRELSVAVRGLSEGHFETRAEASNTDETGKLARNINQLAETLEKNRSSRQRWMADIAHELRTPVAIMKGEIEAVSDGVRPADERMAASLGEEVNHLASLVENLQALALADAGALNLNMESMDLADLVQQSAGLFGHRLAEKDIQFELNVPEAVKCVGDPQRLRQLLHNLLENSCKYAQQSGCVKITLHGNRETIELVIEDSGPGVGEDQLGRLFDRFYRAEKSRSRATGGSGLGLAISRNIVEAHGGKITATHSALGGLAIQVVLPARQV